MTVEKIATQYETFYIANDGRKWRSEAWCKQYEELLADPSPIKNLKFFNGEGEPIDVFALGKIPCFCYLVLTDTIKEYHWSVIKAILGNRANDEASYNLPTSEGVWFNDWSEAFNGGYGRNGWVREDSIEYLTNKIKSCQDKIKLLEKITKPLDN
jgi:hypothetical protein